jgi:hypothetical protein
MSHSTVHGMSPAKIAGFHQRNLIETLFACFVASIGYPRFAAFGFFVVRKFEKPFRVAFIAGLVWLPWFGYSTFVGGSSRWYGALLLLWGLLNYTMYLEQQEIGSSRQHGVKRYTIVWLLRIVSQFVLNSLRWFVWCDCVFPYVIRWDVYFLGALATLAIMWAINLRKPVKILKFTRPLGNHMPAPDASTAVLCDVCRDCQYTIDLEQGPENQRSGFTVYEDADSI